MKTLLAISMVFAATLAAQTTEPSFDAASVKLHPPPAGYSMDPQVRGSRLVGTASTLRDLITSAYGIRYDQISGGPAWLASDRYDLEARAAGDGPLTRDQAMAMLRTLLADRFHLKFHRDTKDLAVYELVSGKGGPKFKPAGADATGGAATRTAPNGSLKMEATKTTMESLARQLTNTAGRPVIDKTGLAGFYAFTLEWTTGDRADSDTNLPSIFTAVQDQLGLKLEPAKDPFDFLVIDSAAKPSAN